MSVTDRCKALLAEWEATHGALSHEWRTEFLARPTTRQLARIQDQTIALTAVRRYKRLEDALKLTHRLNAAKPKPAPRRKKD
jgi:hypothetical protein